MAGLDPRLLLVVGHPRHPRPAAESSDLQGPAGPVLVNEAFERAYFPDGPAVGQRVRMDGGRNNPSLTIVGVVRDVRTDGLTANAEPTLHVPHPHFDAATSQGPIRSMALVMRTTLDQANALAGVRERLRTLDPELPVVSVSSMSEVVAAAAATQRIVAVLLGAFATIALVLGAVGVHGVLAYETSMRIREMGLRAALGAGRGRLVREVLSEGLTMAALGVLAGLALAPFAARLLGAYLFGVGPSDPWSYAAVAAVLMSAALLASWAPAMRAASSDPVASLRAE